MKKAIVSCLTTFAALTLSAQSFKFDFGAAGVKPPAGYIKITPGDRYTQEKGYGFDLIESHPQAVDNNRGKGVTGDFITAPKPFFFSVKVPDGNYRVTVTLGDTKGASLTTIKAESRRLMELGVATEKGGTIVRSFNVNVRNTLISGDRHVKIKDRERNKLNWDNKLTLEFNDDRPAVCAVEIERTENVVTLFLCGNSTVVDQDYEPWCGWGQIIPLFFDDRVSIANYAESGEAANTFIAAGRLEKLLTQAKRGDYIFIEFGHNDQKQTGEGRGPYTSYKESLRKFIVAARSKQCEPVLITPMHRRNFDDTGRVRNTLGDYPDAVRQLAAEEHVMLIDLNKMSAVLYEAMGVEGSIRAFVHYPANTFEGQTAALADNTHFNCYGGMQIAKCIVEGIRANNTIIARFFRSDYKRFDPAHPDDPAKFRIPLSPFVEVQKPDGN